MDWGGDQSIGNVPNRESDYFPSGNKAFSLLLQKIGTGQFVGKQIDWGAHAAIVTRADILAFIDEVYRDSKMAGGFSLMPHQLPEIESLLEYVRALPEDGRFALVASEL